MKSYKVWLTAITVVLLLTCFAFGTAHTQDLSGWVGTWFKLTYTFKGYETFSESTHHPVTQSDKTTLYLKITQWDTTNPNNLILKCTAYGIDDEGEEGVTQINLDLIYLGGADLDFLVLCHIAGEQRIGFAARISGKESKGTLKSGTFKTLGGYSWERSSEPNLYPRDCEVGGLTITGNLISDSKLPFWVPK